ncbi:hypothetical protein B0H17DRAFT_1126512 [Mycena rosella]|uniref:Uncharacterized protein n=1 Tax=Mycena rosella TaxID=1033263 RepID=A0AAD7GT93_MYCRO|nr:hypothetical protein B0H17DRAFT_1126512 [Mycena rosella]
MSDSSTSESEKEQEVQIPHTFSVPNQNAGVPEFLEALKTTQKLVHELAAENKSLCAEISKYKASKPRGKGRKQKSTIIGGDTHRYYSKIIALGKVFGVMVDPWVQSMVFSQKTALLLAMPANIFKSDSTPQYLTAALYAHIDEKFHGLINTSAYLDFAWNIFHPPVERTTSLEGPEGYIMGKRQPQNPGNSETLHSVVGYKWKIVQTIFILYWTTQKNMLGKPEHFEEIGTISKILFRHIFIRFLPALKMMGVPGLRRVIKFWHSVHLLRGRRMRLGLTLTKKMAGALAGLDIEGILDHDANPLSIINWDSDDAPPVAPPAPAAQRPAPPVIQGPMGEGSEAEEPAPHPRRPRDPAPSVPTTDEEDVDEIPAPCVEEEEGSDLTALSNKEMVPAAQAISSEAVAPNPPANVSEEEPVRKGGKS